MFYPNLHQLEQRSVHTPTLDESVPQQLFDKRPSSISSRPYSAKDDSQPTRSANVRPVRPVSASKQPPASMANLLRKRLPSPRKERDVQALARLRPRRIAIEKERLYDDAMHLKIENNDLRTENTKLKTRVSQLDRELTRAQERLEDAMADRSAAASAHLVAGLKQTIKDLRLAMKAKDIEVAVIRKSARSTKVEELEIELQTYVEECRRLQAALNDVLKQDEAGGDQDASKQELSQLRSELKKARADHRVQQELISSLQSQLSQARTPPRDSRAEMLERQLNQHAQDKTRLVEEHRAAIDDLQRELAEAGNRAREAERKHSEEMEDLREELRGVRDQSGSYDGQVESLRRAVKGKEAEVESLQQSLSAMQQELEQAKYSCESLTDDISALQDSKRRLEAQISKVQAEAERSSEEVGHLRSELAESEAQVSSLQAKMRKRELETGAREEEHQTHLTALVMQHKKELAEIGNRSTALRDLEENNKRLREECARLQGELESRNREMQTAQTTLLQTQEDRNNLQTRVTTLEKEIADLRSELEMRSQRLSKALSPHFFVLKDQLSLDSENPAIESSDMLAQRLRSTSLDTSVVEMMLLQVSDRSGNVSLRKLREELQAAESLKPATLQEREQDYSLDDVEAEEEVFEEPVEVPQAQEVLGSLEPVESPRYEQEEPSIPKSDHESQLSPRSQQEAPITPRSQHEAQDTPRSPEEKEMTPRSEEREQHSPVHEREESPPRSDHESSQSSRSQPGVQGVLGSQSEERISPRSPQAAQHSSGSEQEGQETPRSPHEAHDSPKSQQKGLSLRSPQEAQDSSRSEKEEQSTPRVQETPRSEKEAEHTSKSEESVGEQLSEEAEVPAAVPLSEDRQTEEMPSEPVEEADYKPPAHAEEVVESQEEQYSDSYEEPVAEEPVMPDLQQPIVAMEEHKTPAAVLQHLPSDLPSSSSQPLPDSDHERPQGPTPRDSQEDEQSARVPASPSAVRLADVLRHVSFRLQITRLAKQDLGNLLFEEGKQASVASLREHLMSPPLSITEASDLDLLLSAVQATSDPLPVAETIRRLEDLMEDWRIFSQQDEDEFDREIAEALYPRAEDFLGLCDAADTAGSGLIAYSDFVTIVERLHLNLTSAHLQYLQLLFYSEGQQLDVVPYQTLIHAYAGQEDDQIQELTETQTRAVRGQLELLAAHTQGIRLDEVFGPDSRGFISPAAFVAGLAAVGLQQPDDETLDLLFQSLQAEEAEEMCIALADLMEILGSLQGVKSKKSSMSGLDE